MMEIFERRGTILRPETWPYPVNAVFNAGATILDGETLLLVRVEGRSGASHLTVAESADGFGDWRVRDEPTLAPHPGHPEEQWGVEDPRITLLPDGRFAVAYTGYWPEGPCVCLATTRDFRTFERHGVSFCPENKDAALFPARFSGDFLMLHRPVAGDNGNIWISRSPDLVHWGRHHVVLRARSGPYWDSGKVGLSAQPLETAAGWLILYHGVKRTCFGSIYRQGLALLDRQNPTKLLGRTREWVFAPWGQDERVGDVGNVAFSCGWTLVGSEVRMYYGAADTCMAVAVAPLDRLLDQLG